MKQFVLFLTFAACVSCSSPKQISRIEGHQVPITETVGSRADFESVIKPYRDNIDRDMNKVLCYNPRTLDKTDGRWQTGIGSVMADATLQKANEVLAKRNLPPADMAMLNFGGIRSVIPEGNVTVRTAFEVMPFENSLSVVDLKGEQIVELLQYFVSERKAHPLSGIGFTIKDAKAINVSIQGKPFDISKTYRVVTSDYLVQGGDRMDFFKKGPSYELDYKLRNVLIDYFKEQDTLRADPTTRITEIK